MVHFSSRSSYTVITSPELVGVHNPDFLEKPPLRRGFHSWGVNLPKIRGFPPELLGNHTKLL